jgi:hypothetical protein
MPIRFFRTERVPRLLDLATHFVGLLTREAQIMTEIIFGFTVYALSRLARCFAIAVLCRPR